MKVLQPLGSPQGVAFFVNVGVQKTQGAPIVAFGTP
jgi:hypothetical protein